MKNRVLVLFLGSSTNWPGSALAEACLQISPVVALRENEAVFIHLEGLERITSPERVRLKAEAILRRFQLKAHLVLAPTASEALARARYPKSQSLPIEAVLDFYDPFGVDEVDRRKLLELTQISRKLGIETLEDFRSLPTSEVVARFGERAMDLAQRLHSQREEIWPRFRVTEQIMEEQELPDMPFHSLNVTLEPLLFVLKGMLDKLCSRLRGRGLRLQKLELTLGLEKFSNTPETKRTLSFDFPLPQGHAQSLLNMVHERLAHELQTRPVETAIQSLRLCVLETSRGYSAQSDFFCKKEQEQETANALIARLTQKLGESSAFYAVSTPQILPERAWEKTLSPHTTLVSPNLPLRPTRLLKSPVLLHYREGSFIAPGTDSRWKILKTDGPEKFSIEWWSQPVEREYYQVQASGGETLWVYYNPQDKNFYLHGYFD